MGDKPRFSETVQGRISRRMVQLQREFYGRGPTKITTYVHDDMVTVLMRGGFNRVEATLLKAGHGESVIKQRSEFQSAMHDRYIEIIENETGRKVAAFMSGIHQEPDLVAEMFVLAPTDGASEEKAKVGPVVD